MEDHDLLVRIDERLQNLTNPETGDIPEIKKRLTAINSGFKKHEQRITHSETYLKVIGGAITIAAASIINLFLRK